MPTINQLVRQGRKMPSANLKPQSGVLYDGIEE